MQISAYKILVLLITPRRRMRVVISVKTQGGFAPSGKNVFDMVSNYWTWFKKFGSLAENFSPLLVSQTGYWLASTPL